MALSPDLIGFVKESLHRGLPRADVEQVLLRAGWPAEQVKMKGVARVRLRDGRLRLAELHWYEAHGIGQKEFKRKRFLD